jgi:hypothetical protein
MGDESAKLIGKNDGWKTKFWYWGGLTSKDVGVRRRSQLFCGVCWTIIVVFIILMFTVRKSAIHVFSPADNINLKGYSSYHHSEHGKPK